MKNKNVLIVTMTFISGLLLYFGASKLMGYLLFKTNKVENFAVPIVTEHEGDPLPNIDLLLSDSLTHLNITSIPSGKAVVLFYFGPYCPYCQSEIDEITKNMDHLKNIQFYLITPYSVSEMKTFYFNNKLRRFSNIIIGRDHEFKFGSYFKTQSVPYLAIYTSDRKLHAAFSGNINSKQIKTLSEK